MIETPVGATLVNADGRTVPVRLIGEPRVRVELGSIPSFADWARTIAPQGWMLRRHPLDQPLDGETRIAEPGGELSSDGLPGAEARSVRIEFDMVAPAWRASEVVKRRPFSDCRSGPLHQATWHIRLVANLP